ncbi:hypothetical protein HK098_008126 [Nowakowskiella sp. JEL0407]|nr:hypothetical protein HK098_008126 [Nowakowskiella sp. JEL0407]
MTLTNLVVDTNYQFEGSTIVSILKLLKQNRLESFGLLDNAPVEVLHVLKNQIVSEQVLKSLKIAFENEKLIALENISGAFEGLESLMVRHKNLTWSCLNSCFQLKELHIFPSDCSESTIPGLIELLNTLSSLTKLIIEGEDEEKESAMYLPILRSLETNSSLKAIEIRSVFFEQFQDSLASIIQNNVCLEHLIFVHNDDNGIFNVPEYIEFAQKNQMRIRVVFRGLQRIYSVPLILVERVQLDDEDGLGGFDWTLTTIFWHWLKFDIPVCDRIFLDLISREGLECVKKYTKIKMGSKYERVKVEYREVYALI